MSFPPIPGADANLRGFRLVADTGAAGFALQNGTPVILSWTAPNDGRQHSVMVMGGVHCTSAATGGAVNYTGTRPDGSVANVTVVTAGQVLGSTAGLSHNDVIEAGTTVTLNQSSALTAGAELVFATLWAY